ncbi:MAG: cell division protein FtsA, partial [Verrucomicrobiales bacterium]|nr:cell division protein FtsA [Verrucomicrobiales bacterium]
VLNPIGMFGTKLEADYHIIHAMRARIQNTIRCVREIPLEVEDVVYGPIAAAQVLLSRSNKENGALVIDLGGGTTDFVLYSDGSVTQSGSVGLGGDHVTNDISIVLKLPQAKAAKVKEEHGSAWIDASLQGKTVTIDDEARFVGTEVDLGMLNEIIHMRMREVFELLKGKLEQGGFIGRVSDGIFLCGGCSMLEGVDKLAEEVLKLPVQRANSAPVSGLTATFENPQYAVPIGLIRYAQILENERPRRGALARVGEKLTSFFGAARLFS